MRSGYLFTTVDHNNVTHRISIEPKPNSSEYFFQIDDRAPYPMKEGEMSERLEGLAGRVRLTFEGEMVAGKLRRDRKPPRWVPPCEWATTAQPAAVTEPKAEKKRKTTTSKTSKTAAKKVVAKRSRKAQGEQRL